MTVLCIDDSRITIAAADFVIKENEQYEVIRTFQQGKPDWWWYELSIQPGVGYAVERFIPVSEINEKEFERNYNFQTV